jgi:cephalosporin-C deacetylase-like acetyl esterase
MKQASIISRVKPHPEGGFVHNLRDKFLTGMGATADHFLRSFLSTRMLASNIPNISRVMDKEYRKKWDFYTNPDFIPKPAKFFLKPESLEPLVRPADPMPLPLNGAIYEDIIFPSDMHPANPGYHQADVFPTTQAPSIARLIRHKDGDRPTIIVVHGYVLDGYRFNAALFEVQKFFRHGFNVLMYTMPYHGSRKVPGARFSGDGFMYFDAGRIAENVRWSMHDLTRYVDFLAARSKQPIGMMGFSLGGYHTALMASLEKRLAFAIPVVPVITLFNVILDWQPSAAVIRAFMKILSLDQVEINKWLAVVSPLSRPPAIAKDRLLIIAGTADRMAHPDHAHSLWHHWEHPKIYWFPGNHLVHFEKTHYMREVMGFLRGLKMF